MKTFKQFIAEEKSPYNGHIASRLSVFKAIRNKFKPIKEDNEIPFDHSPKIGWWKDQKMVTVYHGTHERNIPDIAKNGINRKDPKTGMISLALDPHTAHGYAAMSSAGGERHFRDAGAKAVTTPHEQRSVVKMQIPKAWIDKHIDPNLRGNIGVASGRLNNKDEYSKWKGADHEYYQMSEIRVSKEVPAKFIQGVMKKSSPLKEEEEEKGPWALATQTRKGTWRRIPDTKWSFKSSAVAYGEKYHRGKYGEKRYKVVLHPDANKKDDD